MTGDAVCWVITPCQTGMRSQALGLAEAVGLPIVEKRIALRRPWWWLPGGFLPTPLGALAATSDPLRPPWPALVVACGRRSIGAALAVKRQSRGKTLAAYIQNPEWGRKKFDLIAAMPHDGVSGSNVVMLRTALHAVTEEKLNEARDVWHGRLNREGAPLLGVLVGGDNGRYRLTGEIVAQLIRVVHGARAGNGFHAAITSSRRTGEPATNALKAALGGKEWTLICDERGPNPYLGILALADRLIVTGESISMISEALATGRPVHVLPLAGQGGRHDAFLTRIIDAGLVSLVVGDDLNWNFAGSAPINSAAEPAKRLRAMLGLAS